MRSKDRIKPLLERLEKIWTNHSDQRLGQLIKNATNNTVYIDVWNMEDEQILESLERQFLKRSAFELILESVKTGQPVEVKDETLSNDDYDHLQKYCRTRTSKSVTTKDSNNCLTTIVELEYEGLNISYKTHTVIPERIETIWKVIVKVTF